MPLNSGFAWGLKEDEKPKDDLQNGTPSKSRSTYSENDGMEPIAVIGFAARLPQDATSVEGFWQMLSEGRSARTEVPKTRFNIDAFYHPDPERVDTVSWIFPQILLGPPANDSEGSDRVADKCKNGQLFDRRYCSFRRALLFHPTRRSYVNGSTTANDTGNII